MVRFVDVAHMTRWIADTGVETIVADLADALEGDFRRWPEFDLRPRVASHSEHGVIELMPTSDGRTYTFKFVNGHPINATRGLQTVTAFGALADVDTGYPLLISEMTLLTALRTAATSAMVARRLAPPGSRVMGMIGTGAQSEFQASAFRRLVGIEEFRVWDVDPAAMEKFRRNATDLGFDVTVCTSGQEAIEGADVVTTCTADKRNATVLTDEMVRAAEPSRRRRGAGGLHVNAIGGDCPGKTELDVALVERARVFVEYTEQSFIEGEIQALPRDFPVTEFWQVLTGERPGRVDDGELTVFDSVGFAIEDFTALRFLYERITGTGHHETIDLVAEPADPKNLFGEVVGSLAGAGSMR